LNVFGIHQLALRQQARHLEVEQRRRDQQELARLIEFVFGVESSQVGDELVGHLAQRDLGDVEFVLGDQGQQQIERTGEVRQRQPETRCFGGLIHRHGSVLHETRA
jgi:hypothetical protein